jgi:hypothetical protein
MSRFFRLGSTLVDGFDNLTFNPLQVAAYVNAGLGGGAFIPPHCVPSELEDVLPEDDLGPWTTPEADSAWWFNSSRPETAGFAGVYIEQVEFAPEYSRDYKIIQGCRPTARPGPAQDDGYTITVNATLYGATCCAVTAGLAILKRVLRYPSSCTGTTMEYPLCIPQTDPTACNDTIILPPETQELSSLGDVVADGNPGPWRTMYGVALVEDVTIGSVTGPSCSSCDCAPITEVVFVLRSAPGRHTELVTTDIYEQGLYNPAICADACSLQCGQCAPDDPMTDPTCATTAFPPRAPRITSRCLCSSLFRARVCDTIDTTAYGFYPTHATIVIESGASALRNLSVRFWPEVPGQADLDYLDCASSLGFGITFLPAGYTLTIDGRSGAVTAVDGDGNEYDARKNVIGPSGFAFSGCIELTPGDWKVCEDIDCDSTAADATITVYLSQVEP